MESPICFRGMEGEDAIPFVDSPLFDMDFSHFQDGSALPPSPFSPVADNAFDPGSFLMDQPSLLQSDQAQEALQNPNFTLLEMAQNPAELTCLSIMQDINNNRCKPKAAKKTKGKKSNHACMLTKNEETRFIELLETKANSITDGGMGYMSQSHVRFLLSQIYVARGMQPAHQVHLDDAELRSRCAQLSEQLLQRERHLEAMAFQNTQLQTKIREMQQEAPKHAAASVCIAKQLNEAQKEIVELQKKATEEESRRQLADMEAKKKLEELQRQMDSKVEALDALQKQHEQTIANLRMEHEAQLAAKDQDCKTNMAEFMSQQTAREESLRLQWEAKVAALQERSAAEVATWKAECQALTEAQVQKQDLLCPQVQDTKPFEVHGLSDANVDLPISAISDFVFLPNRSANQLTLSEIADELGEQRFGACVTAPSNLTLKNKIEHIFCVVTREHIFHENVSSFIIVSLSELLHCNRFLYGRFLVSNLTKTGLEESKAETFRAEIDSALFGCQKQSKKRK